MRSNITINNIAELNFNAQAKIKKFFEKYNH